MIQSQAHEHPNLLEGLKRAQGRDKSRLGGAGAVLETLSKPMSQCLAPVLAELSPEAEVELEEVDVIFEDVEG